MSVYKVSVSPRALKQLSKLDKPIVVMLKKWIQKNLDGTDSPRKNGKALSGDLGTYWRYRVGNYRIIVEILDSELIEYYDAADPAFRRMLNQRFQ